MLVVISPAKRLDWSPVDVTSTAPDFQHEANILASHARALTLGKLKGLMDLSDDLARLNRDRFRVFEDHPSPKNSKPAVFAFAGDTYLGLEAGSLDADTLDYAQRHLRILSGLYGVLRPMDAIQPYRLEMGSRLKTRRGTNLYDFWRDVPAKALNAAAEAAGSDILVNCASQEYFGAVDRKKLKPRLIEPVFMEVANGAVEFVPKPADTKALIAAHYSVPRTLLIRFQDDSIDETNEVEAALVGGDTHSADSGDSSESSSDNSHSLDVTVLDLAGDHARPLVPEPPELPADVATSINEAGDAISSIADAFGIREDSTDVVANPLGFLRAGFEQARAEVGRAVGGVSEGETESGHTTAWCEADELAGEIAGWMFPETEPKDDVVGAGSMQEEPGVDTPEGRAGEAQAWIDAWRASL